MSHPQNDNPWQDERGQNQNQNQNQYQGQGYQNHDPYSTYQNQPQNPGSQGAQYAPPDHPPPGQQQQRYYQGSTDTPPTTQSQYQPPTESANPGSNPWGSTPHQPSEEVPPGLPPRRTATDLALPTGSDRSHQIEVMQSYEAAGRKDEHDQNVELLQREFPNIDGSLIAAIYGDSQSLSATREMLGELS